MTRHTGSPPARAATGTRDRIAELRRIARERFGWSGLSPEQTEAMGALLDGRDVLVVMPTGSGKSAIHQVPTVMFGGPAVVVSPLIALQHDQVAKTRQQGGDTHDDACPADRRGLRAARGRTGTADRRRPAGLADSATPRS